MLQIRKILFQVSDFTRYVTERSRDVRVNPLTRGISINLSSVSMASHISPTAVHVDSPDPIQIAFKEPKNSSLKTRSLFSTVRRIMVSGGGGAYMHLCAEGGVGGCLCQVMQHEVALGAGVWCIYVTRGLFSRFKQNACLDPALPPTGHETSPLSLYRLTCEDLLSKNDPI